MRDSITQEYDYGCGIACFAFAARLSYRQAEKLLGKEQSRSNRFWCKDLSSALTSFGLQYKHMYVKPRLRRKLYREGVIVLIARSKHYPYGHYLIRHKDKWMDPWINLLSNNDIKCEISGYRKRLPGRPMYFIEPG